jgi:sigma-54 dependent transcriptional regulator, acetoin dehydrogenase operon transcriptional activator AcoR
MVFTPNLNLPLSQSPTTNPYYITGDRWEKILECKERFLLDPNMDPRNNDFMNPEVAESWLRSRKLGINPYTKLTEPHLSPNEHRKILEDNRLLIDITKPLVDTFKEMAILTSGYILYLCNEDGVFLLQECERMRVSIEGLIWNENTIGTNVHSLCKRLRQPVQLFGPEHYCVGLHNIIASAAPIMNESGEPIATLILSQPLVDKHWGNSFQNSLSHTLGLVSSLASAVEGQIKLFLSNEKLKHSNGCLKIANYNLKTTKDTLEATFSFIDEGIITIDRNGTILSINQEGLRILKRSQSEIENANIKDYLGRQSRVMTSVIAGKSCDIEEMICSGNDEQHYVINIRPILDPNTDQVEVAVLRLNHVEKVNALVVNRSGAVASYNFDSIIGENKELKKVISLSKKFANSAENILLIGESGTGKELFAQAIHNIHRPNGPFMAVNCAAMPRELIESELFGYESGSFTGADRSGRPGKIELAHGGTLFLDEIGDMPLEIQAVLLRTLEDKQVMRIGGRRYKKVDFRLIAATNKNLFKMVKDNQYREDLYFRLSVLTINIPPLRKRNDDIEILSRHFIKSYCQKQGWKYPQISPATIKIVNEYEWPGNIRQLQNALIYAVNSAQDEIIQPENLPSYILLDSNPIRVDQSTENEMLCLETLEKNAIKTALLHTSNSIPDAAKILGISRSTLYRKLKDYNLEQ